MFLVAILIPGLAIFWRRDSSNPRVMARESEHYVQAKVDPAVLQAWATNLLNRFPSGRTNYAGPFDCPSYLEKVWRKRKPGVYIKGGYDGEAPYVDVFWGGGGIGHWGLMVGDTNFTPRLPGRATTRWRKGIYFFEDFH